MVILSAIQHCYGQYLYSSVGINNFARALFYGVDFFSLFKFNQTSKINLWSWIDGKVKFVFLCKVKAQPFLEEIYMRMRMLRMMVAMMMSIVMMVSIKIGQPFQKHS